MVVFFFCFLLLHVFTVSFPSSFVDLCIILLCSTPEIFAGVNSANGRFFVFCGNY